MKVAILGYGEQGRSAYKYWSRRGGNTVTICDQNKNVELPKGVKTQLGEGYLENLDVFDLVVRSPSVHPRDIVAANDGKILDKVTTVTNEFMRVSPSKHIIGVTGTKGKGTTCTLIAKMLESAGKKVHLGGNIGTPPLDLLKNSIQQDDYVVLELANFQLIDLKYSPPIAVCLMVTDEHLDWHTDMAEYIRAKQQLFIHQKADDKAIYNGHDETSKQIAEVSPGVLIPYMRSPGAELVDGMVKLGGENICATNELKLLGKHNWQNVCAAVTTVWQVVQDIDAVRSVLTSFTGLEHRLEFVREVDGVKYYDDSFGTTPQTAIVAIEALAEPKIVILGGSEKGASYDRLAQTVRDNNVKSVVIIGLTGPKIAVALRKVGFTEIIQGGNSMSEIVQIAKRQAAAGDVVLLSTACASFDMFKNYKDRGEQFKQAVRALVSVGQ